ncbi:TolC family protein [Thiomicrospira microaerophila]|uniref:TolC family protein n=1 Tax=Thiomicrospira microaerophila TaxID=406020 RepID=UPI0018E0A711|nr:TolC family protein [Thiomicrospira microaerophila]
MKTLPHLTSRFIRGACLSAMMFGTTMATVHAKDIPLTQHDGQWVWPLDQQGLVMQLVKRNAQILYSQMQMDIAAQQHRHERGIFEAELFSTLRYDDTHVQAGVDQLTSINAIAGSGQKREFIETRTTGEIGVVGLLRSGAEVQLSYREQKRASNHITGPSPSIDEANVLGSEMTGAVNLTITQPLLRGWMAKQAKTRIEQAKLEQSVVAYQYQQQLMRSSFDALSAYWQLYRIEQFKHIRQEALDNARNTYTDIAHRVEAGRLSETTLLEAQSNIYSRQAELESVQGAHRDAVNRLKTLVNLSTLEHKGVQLVLQDAPLQIPYQLTIPFEAYFEMVLAHWPAYQIAESRRAIQDQALIAARDELKPKLDLRAGYTTNGLGETHKDAREFAFSNDYPTWFTSLNMSIPLQGNQRARSKESIAQQRIQQSNIDLDAVKIGLANDLQARLAQLEKAFDEVQVYQKSEKILRQVYEVELGLFNSGLRRLSDVYDREDRLNQGRQRYIDALVRYELALLSLRLAEGTLLAQYGVTVSDVNTLDDSPVKPVSLRLAD